MRIFIWRRLDVVSDSYHPEGGLVVIAENRVAAMSLAHAHGVPTFSRHREERDPARTFLNTEADLDIDVGNNVEPQVIVFVDSGCC